MRTSPAYAPEIKVGADGTRTAPGAPRMSILMPPGTYTVKLSAAGTELRQPLIIKKDPNSGGTEADIMTQTTMLLGLRKDLETGSQMVNQIEFIRSQIYQLTATLDGSSDSVDVKSAAEAFDTKLIQIEEILIQRKLTGQGQDTVRYPPKFLSKLSYLASGLASGDFAPTKQQLEVREIFGDQLIGIQNRYDVILNRDLPAFNKLLADRNIKSVIKPTP
jgi:hypothetical protein